MASKINYNDKAPFQNDPDIPDDNKVLAKNMNEIKTVVNANADELDTAKENIENLQGGQGTSNAEITSLKNRVSTLETDNTTNKSNITNLQSNKVDKVEGKGLSTEDFTTELKSKLEGLKNYDDTEIKEDISNLEAGQTEQDKQIDMLINALPSETQESENINIKGTIPTKFKEFVVGGNSKQETREGYNLLNVSEELEVSIFKEITVNLKANSTYTLKFENAIAGADNNQSLITFRNTADVISRVIDTSTTKEITVQPEQDITNIRIYASTDYTSSTGKTKTFEKLMLYEGTDDKEYEAYGAMPSPEFISKIQNVSTVNLVGGQWLNGLYDANGNFGLTSGVYRCFKKFLKAGTYVYSCNADIVRARSVNLTTNTILNVQTGNIFTLQEDAEISLGFRKTSGLEWDLGENLEDIEFQLEEGTVATEYKTNGINVTVGNKNWVEVDNINKEYITMNGNGTFTINGTLQQNDNVRFISSLFLPAGKYRMSLGIDYNKFNNSYYNIAANGEQLKYFNRADVSFELEEAASINATTILIAGTYSNLIVKPMIERTDRESSSDWIEHQEQIVNFPLAQGQKLMLGDYLAADGIHHKRKQIELDGTDFSLYSNQVAGRTIYMISAFSNNNNFKTYDSSILCNILKQGTSSNGNNYLNNNGSSGSLYVSIENSILGITNESTEEEKLQALQNLIAETGFVYEGELAEEETEAYTEEQQEAYNQLKQLTAYDEETNVYSTNEVSPIFKVTAVKDINSVITQLNTVLLERS